MRGGLYGWVLATIALALSVLIADPSAQDVQRWNRIFGTAEYSSDLPPNAFLARIADTRKPGTALDIAMGQGRNSLMLAARGWTVTGFDLSDVAVSRATALARQRGVGLTALVSDVNTFPYGEDRWDLISAIYIHGLLTPNSNKVIRSLRAGGVLVIEGFHREALDAGYRNNELLQTFGALTILHYEDAIGSPDLTWSNDRQFRFVRLVARKDLALSPEP